MCDVDLHHLHFHRYGDHTELTFHIRLDKNMSLHEAHEISTNIEQQIKSELGMVATIHYEPS